MKVDLNSDLGEGAGHDDEILSLVSSANIACGFHAANPASIFNSIRAAKEKGVAVGAHPSLDDRKNFGRTEMQVSAAEVYALVAYQVGAAERVLRMLKEGKIRAVDGTDISVRAETICLHGDTPGAVEFARTLRARLEGEGIIIAAPEKS